MAPVGQFRANKFGIFDLAGNVSEWCADSYKPASNERVTRGGSWQVLSMDELLAGYRGRELPTVKAPTIGFRCVMEIVPH